MKTSFLLGALILVASISNVQAQTCRTDSFGTTRCDNGQTFRRDSFGTTRDNYGNSWRTDSFGTTRGSDGTTYRTDSFGTTRDNHGNSWRTDSFGTTRGSNGTTCRTDNLRDHPLQLGQHAGHRLCGVRLATLVEIATCCQFSGNST